ncbi:MAG: hypothetical protein GKS00_24540 [Alphaproteobacteria bacterium]|nr:hypothetical protein [Alphaproteobacteria bacterium]
MTKKDLRRYTVADDSWRLLGLGIASEDIVKARARATFAASLHSVFRDEFGADGEIIAAMFCEANRQLEMKLVSVDIQGLANGLGWKYATTHDRCRRLKEKGHLIMGKTGRHTAISWTDETLVRIIGAFNRVSYDQPL